MRIVRLYLRHYRNLAETLIEPHERFNVVHGRNAQGKTNLLEAVYLLATLRSFRVARSGDLVAWGTEGAQVEAIVERRGVQRTYQVRIDREGRAAAVDGKRIDRLSQYFGDFNVVLFTPEDLAISKGDPGVRRRYLDRAVFNADPGHMELVREYDRALRSRNTLLRETGAGARVPHAAAMMAAFDEPLAELAARVVLRRRRYLEGLVPVLAEAHAAITGEPDDVGLRYRSSLDGGAGGEAAARPELPPEAPDDERLARLRRAAVRRLEESLETDRARGYTGVGPHMDDLVATLDGRSLRRFGSQGQHRTFVLALKLAEIAYLHHVAGFRPILLLDDVSSELDVGRGGRFMELVQERGGQVFVTTTDPRHVVIARDVAVWQIVAGAVTPEHERSPGAPGAGGRDGGEE
jgi:DNA replication and repair protein RecF